MKVNDRPLPEADIRAILRAADAIIGQGGRTLLAKILKGSREKKLLELELDHCPVYGYFYSEKIDDILTKVDWMIDYDFLDLEYFGKLPMIIYTERGWLIERDQRTNEFLQEWDQWLEEDKPCPDMTYLKDRNREMIHLLLDKIKETQDQKYIPFLEEWEKVDYKKVKSRIRSVIKALQTNEPIDRLHEQRREEDINEALKGDPPQDLLLKCWECGERFLFTIGEQKYYKQKGFVYPKRCEECRDKRMFGDFL